MFIKATRGMSVEVKPDTFEIRVGGHGVKDEF
jgi:hypothetical protein